MPPASIQARAALRVRHERRYDYDERRGLWLYERVDEDEECGNILTDGGRIALHTFVYGTIEQRTAHSLGDGFHFVAVSNDAVSPDSNDVTLAGELTSHGLERVLGTVVLPTGVGAITQIENVFTYTGGGTQGMQKTALFDTEAGGNMAHEVLFTQRVLGTSDHLTLNFLISLG